MKLRNEIFHNEVFEFSPTPDNLVHQLGNVRFENCTLNINCTATWMIYAGVEIIGGVFNQKKKLVNTSFSRTIFDGVKFTGKYYGVDFGHDQERYEGKIINCDFSDADIHLCRIFGCDAKDLKLPQWPYCTISNPSLARDYVLSQTWPREIKLTLDVITDAPVSCTVSFFNASIYAKKDGLDLNDIKPLLEKIPGLIM